MRRVLLILTALFLIWIPTQYALAFAVAPNILEISGNRGETAQQKLSLINTRDKDQTFYLDVLKFTTNDDGDSPKFIPYEEDHSGLPEWISFDHKTITVPGRSWADISFTISIPKDAVSGGYYTAVTVSESPSEVVASNGTTIQAKTAALLFLTVEGETVEQAGLLNFSITPEDWSDQLTGAFNYRLQNQGNVHFIHTGSLIFRDIFGRTIATVDTNPEKSRVLPNTTRLFEGTFGNKETDFFSALKTEMSTLAIGPISANLEITFGDENQIIEETATFWLIPWRSLLTLGGLIILLLIVSRVLSSLSRKKIVS